MINAPTTRPATTLRPLRASDPIAMHIVLFGGLHRPATQLGTHLLVRTNDPAVVDAHPEDHSRLLWVIACDDTGLPTGEAACLHDLPLAALDTLLTGLRRAVIHQGRHPDTERGHALELALQAITPLANSLRLGGHWSGLASQHINRQHRWLIGGHPGWLTELLGEPEASDTQALDEIDLASNLLDLRRARALWGQDLSDTAHRVNVPYHLLGSTQRELEELFTEHATTQRLLAMSSSSVHDEGGLCADVLHMLQHVAASAQPSAVQGSTLDALRALQVAPLDIGKLHWLHDDLDELLGDVTQQDFLLGPPVHPGLDADVTGAGETWHLRRAQTQGELTERGRLHGHCVGTAGYGARAAAGELDIVLMDRGDEPALTLEIKGGALVQARGPHNRAPTEDECGPLRAWLTHTGVSTELATEGASVGAGTWLTTAVTPEPRELIQPETQPREVPDLAPEDLEQWAQARTLARAITQEVDRQIAGELAPLQRRLFQHARREKARAASYGWTL